MTTQDRRKGERRDLAAANERRALQMAAVCTASLENTPASVANRISQDHPCGTPAYGDVCRAVDREIRERERAEAAESRLAEIEALVALLKENKNVG